MDLMTDLMHGRKGITNRLAYEILSRKGSLSRGRCSVSFAHFMPVSDQQVTEKVSAHCIIGDDETLGGFVAG